MEVQICEHCAGKEKEEIMRGFKDCQEQLEKKGQSLKLEKAGCLGTCRGPVVRVEGKVYSEVRREQIEAIVSEALKE